MTKQQANLRLGEILIKEGWIRQDELDQALQEQRSSGEFLGSILLNRRYIDEKKLTLALSEQFGIPCVSLKQVYIDWNLVSRFSATLTVEHQCFPLQQEETAITFAVTNPLDAWAMGEAEKMARGLQVKFVLGTKSEMEGLLARYREEVKLRIRESLKKGETSGESKG